MKALKRLVIGSSASMLTEKQMKVMRGGYGEDGPWYCHCNNESWSIYTPDCSECPSKCDYNPIWSCDHDPRGLHA